MAEFKLDRFKYTWKGDWEADTNYIRDDIVRVNGKSYVCLVTHTSDEVFANDLNAILPNSNPPQIEPKWKVMTSGRSFMGNWTESSAYNLGDIVLYDGTLWLATSSHTASSFSEDLNNWTVFAKSIKFVGEWTEGNVYGHGAIVKYGGNAYKCLISHTAGITLEVDEEKWEEFFDNACYAGEYVQAQQYRKNDYVKYGGSIFRCLETNLSGSFDSNKFELVLPGNQYDGEWNSITHYTQGDIVRYGGTLYFAVNNNTDSDPSREPDDSTVDWIVLSSSYNFRGSYAPQGEYKTGDVVLRGGYLYVAVRDINLSQGDGSTIDNFGTDPASWELLVPGKTFANNWDKNIRYSIGDTVYHLGTAYTCNIDHISSDENFPGDNGSGIFYWDTLIQAGQPGGLHDKGDLLTYGLSREVVGDGSTLADIRVPIGEQNQVLSISEDLEVFWRNRITDSDVVYVAAYTGSDRTGYGLSPDTPFKTVRYAADYVQDNYPAGTLVTIKVATGRYNEIAPITVPAGCAIVGDELRATTVVANPPFPKYQDDWQYVTPYLDYFTTWLFDLITKNEVARTEGNTEKQFFDFTASDVLGANQIVALIDIFKDYVQSRLDLGSNEPLLTGTNDKNTVASIFNSGLAIEQNIEFIAAEFYAYMVLEYPDITFDEEKMKADIRALMRGISKDLKLDGSNYFTLLAARRYTNAVNGSQNDDLFYMRDTTGLRQMTTEGLTGTLNPPGVFDLYQRPTGGSLVSLDPGWGPDDDRVWITKRSPYIQGVTNIGNNCTGMKVDGSLHNGGNKSMTANDFTQVLSDGIGAWISNNGRAELVSVFTYYCQVGYLAEDGGVIRATNGNNSYGSFGAIADGNDPSETPQDVLVYNKFNEAQVEQAFAGGTTDELLVFEYSNTGEEYTNAEASIIGAGDFASVDYNDFRDGAVFEARLVNTKDSGSKGGSNYKLLQASAQITPDSTSTLIISNDTSELEEEIVGMRIIITQGRGVGQYGYIQAYDVPSREATVYRESDDQPGWDHLVPGTPIVPDIDSTAQYRIEPRIQVSHPGFSDELINLANARTFVDATFGGIQETYTNLTAGFGSGEALTGADQAIFNVVKTKTNYEVTLLDGGAGYIAGDVLTILGTNLGGETPANDLTITVSSSSEDSTNSILTFVSTGSPKAERIVAVAQPNYAVYSDDGETFSESILSFDANYIKILSGDSRFVAVPTNENRVSFSYTGDSWVTRGLPESHQWSDGTFGDGTFVIISSDSDKVAYSANGLDWSVSEIPEDTSGDSTISQWTSVTYGAGKFVAVSNNDGAAAISSDGVTWERVDEVLPTLTGNIVSLEYGANRYIALCDNGEVTYSLDGETWYAGTTAPNDGGNNPIYIDLKYSQGVFLATSAASDSGPNDYVVTTEDGLVWRENSVGGGGNWDALVFANFNHDPIWYMMSSGSDVNGIAKIRTGCRAKLRSDIFAGTFQVVKIWDSGSGYQSAPTITVTDPNFITEVEIDPRLSDGSLSQPSFINRGSGYRSTTSVITITGDGVADIIPEDNTLTLSGISTVPGPGVQIRIEGIFNEETEDPDDLKLFNGVTITDLGDDGTGNGTRIVRFSISPKLQNEYNLAHGTPATLRSNYSQCRITGHDFLDIGTGNFDETNYPELYAGGAFFTAAPENEVLEENGGRVFYVSTDQDGNFRTGELFSVEQATGIVTISAEFFDLDGLTELALGGVRLGGSGASVQEFSTDVTFSEDSNNVVPTQRAIATFLADRLSVGGENLETNRIIAGRTALGGENNEIETTTGEYLYIPRNINFAAGTDPNGFPTGLGGTIISQILFLRNINDTVQ